MENGRRIYWEKKIKHLNKCKKNNALNYVERFKVPIRYWWSCLACSVTLVNSRYMNDETLILLSFCVFIEMVNCLSKIILKSFLIIVFTSILHLFYRTIIPPTICTTLIFFINRILDPITSDVMNNVTYPRDNTRQIQEIKLQQNKTKKNVNND